MSLESVLREKEFVITAEIGPFKGTDTSEFLETAEALKGRIDAANVTDLQSSVMRLGSLATCHLLKERGLEPIYQITCRDRNRLAIQSDLLSAAVLGIENVLALTGDFPSLGDHPHAKPVFDLDSVQLLWVMRRLQEGFDLSGNPLRGKPKFCPGAVVNPAVTSEAQMELQVIKMEKKMELGAKFFQTQAIFDIPTFERFMERVSYLEAPIIAGIILLKSAKMAQYMNENVAGIFVPDQLIQRMASASSPEDRIRTSIDIAVDLIEKLRPLAKGVHIMAIGWEKQVPMLLDAIGAKKRPAKKRILVLDADPSVQGLIERVCAGKYWIDFGQNRVEALEKVERENPDLIVLGTLGSADESAALCRQLKRDPKYASVPVLVMDVPPEERKSRGWKKINGLTLEAEDYIARPVPDQALLAHIEELMR